MRHLLFVLSVAILLVGCTTDKVTEQQEQHVKPTVMDETTNSEKPAEQQSHNLASFFSTRRFYCLF